jgi:hypothetical protein
VRDEAILDKCNRFVENLLHDHRSSALSLCVTITATIEPNERNKLLLQDRLLINYNDFLNEDDTSYNFYYSFLKTNPCLGEFSLWIQPDIINRVHKQSNILDDISHRFVIAANPKSQIDPVELREKLSVFIAKRCDYPSIIVLGALEAILKIDEANLPALDDKVWQQCLND